MSDELALRNNASALLQHIHCTSDHKNVAPRGVDSTLAPSSPAGRWARRTYENSVKEVANGPASSNAAVFATAHNVLLEFVMISRHTHTEYDDMLLRERPNPLD